MNNTKITQELHCSSFFQTINNINKITKLQHKIMKLKQLVERVQLSKPEYSFFKPRQTVG